MGSERHLTIPRFRALRDCVPEEMSLEVVKLIDDFSKGLFFECPYCGTEEYTRFYTTQDFCWNHDCGALAAAIEEKRETLMGEEATRRRARRGLPPLNYSTFKLAERCMPDSLVNQGLHFFHEKQGLRLLPEEKRQQDEETAAYEKRMLLLEEAASGPGIRMDLF